MPANCGLANFDKQGGHRDQALRGIDREGRHYTALVTWFQCYKRIHVSPKLKVSVLLLNFSGVSLVNGDAGVFELPVHVCMSLIKRRQLGHNEPKISKHYSTERNIYSDI